MTEVTTVDWLGVAPSDDDRRTLEAWARARGVVLALPSDAELPRRPVNLTVAKDVEHDLEAARDGVAKLDVRAAEVALSHADRALRDHPELPQGAWLLAEVHRGWAARWSRIEPTSDERATEEWASARALDGGRAAGVGERSFDTADKPVAFVLEADVPTGATLTWDGATMAPGRHEALAGVHQLTAVLQGSVVFASWVSIAEGSNVRVAVPGPLACSTSDIALAMRSEGGVTASGVRCGAWIAVVKNAQGDLEVARCERDRCGQLLPARVAWPATPVVHPPWHWPAWATWTLIGVAVLAGTGIALGASGVFAPVGTTTTFKNGGIQTESLPKP